MAHLAISKDLFEHACLHETDVTADFCSTLALDRFCPMVGTLHSYHHFLLTSPGPEIRDHLIAYNHSYATVEKSLYLASGYVSLNWLHSPADIFEEKAGNQLTLHQAFRRHVLESGNWTLEAEVLSFFHCSCGLNLSRRQ